MRFKSIYIKEGMFIRKEKFSNSVNLIHSQENSKGKTTLLRFLLYSLGYNVPNTKNIKFDQCEVEATIITDDNDELIIKRSHYDYVVVEKDGKIKTYVLPSQLYELQGSFFKTKNSDILNNILGAFYVDQEKGWTLLNRGVVIGSIHFNIEQLVRGLSGCDCSSLISDESIVLKELNKYRQMASVARYQETLALEEESLAMDSYEDISTAELEKLHIEQKTLKKELARIDKTISDNNRVKQYIADIKLMVKTSTGEIVYVDENNIIGLNDTIDYLMTKRNLIASDMKNVKNSIDKLERERQHENEQLVFYKSEMLAEIFDRKISTVPIDAKLIDKEIKRLGKQLKEIRKSIMEKTKLNNDNVTSLYKNVVKYGTELGIGNAETIASSYLFTSNLKELSGAILHKTVFAFRLAYIIEIQNRLGIKLPIILDSPSGKEVDKKNIQLMVDILKRDFADNQIIIASIFKYDFDDIKIIEITDRLIDKIVENEN